MSASKHLSIIIPAAGLSKRFNHGQKAIVELKHGDSILDRQLRILHDNFPSAEFIVVGGYEADKLYKSLPHWVRFVWNEAYETTNVVHSLDIAMRAITNKRVLIVYGDLVYNDKTFNNFPLEESGIIVSNSMKQYEVGVSTEDNLVTNFTYGLPAKWCHIVYLRGHELKVFKKFCCDDNHKKYFGYEALNFVLEKKGKLNIINPKGMKLVEVDYVEDLVEARKIK